MRNFFKLLCCALLITSPAWAVKIPGVRLTDPGYFCCINCDNSKFLCQPGYYCPGGDDCMDYFVDNVFCDLGQLIVWSDNCSNKPVCGGGDGNCGIRKCPDGMTSNAGAVSVNDCFAVVTEISCNAGTYLPANGSSCTQCLSNSYCPGGDYTPGSTNQGINSCPSNYPNSVAGATTITQCYSNTKSRTWTGNQLACSVPTGCLSATCNQCSGSPCNYTVYSNNSGNGDGTLRNGCSTNNTPCQQTVGNAIADANYYVNGATCTACPSGTFSPSGSTSIDDCGKILRVNDYVVYMPFGRRTEHGLCTMLDGKKYCADVYERE